MIISTLYVLVYFILLELVAPLPANPPDSASIFQMPDLFFNQSSPNIDVKNNSTKYETYTLPSPIPMLTCAFPVCWEQRGSPTKPKSPEQT